MDADSVDDDGDQTMPASKQTASPFADTSGSDTDGHFPHQPPTDGHLAAAKPALKKNRKQHHESDQKKQLKFDEETIAEHNKLRGTRQTIDEPNTPYHAQYDSGAESDGSARPKSPANQKPSVDWDLLQTRLDSVAAVQQTFPSSPSVSSCQADDDDVEPIDDRKKEMRKLEFKEHRKRHYNEMELVRRFRMQGDEALDDDGNNHQYDGNSDDYDRNADADNEQEDDDDDEDLNE